MEKNNNDMSKDEERIERTKKELWQYLVDLCSYRLHDIVWDHNHVKELLNLKDTDVKDIRAYINKFDYSPTSFSEYLNNLIELDLSNNNLKSLPNSFSLLQNLESLALNNNQFSRLPDVIGDLKSLKSLKAHNNCIKEVSENIGNLVNLEYLDLSFNELNNISSMCKHLHRLQYFSLANNQLSRIPDCISIGISNLEILDVSGNKHIIIDIPLCSTHIKKFYAKHNGLCKVFPSWIFSLKHCKVEEVFLDYTRFNKFNFSNDKSVSNIKKLSMVESKLSEKVLQNIIARLPSLESLNVGNDIRTCNNNSFWFLPIQEIDDKCNLREISVHRTGIPAIPKSIIKLANLITIDVSFNDISWLPDEICYLNNLQTLIVNNTLLAYLPESIGQLKSLQKLKASHNLLSCTPSSMMYLYNLKFLDFYDNEFLSARDINIDMTCLQGLNLEKNYFPTSDLPIAKSHYEHLRSTLLEEWGEQYEQLIGPKAESICDKSESSYISSSDDEEICGLENDSEIVEENWDDVDSSDEFDPNEFKEPKPCSNSSYCNFTIFRQQFCPSDIHAESVVTRIIRMISNGTLSFNMDFEEGQFDDN